jgi:hypothetical protein
MTTIYNRTDYVMLPRIQKARTLKREFRNSHFCSWSLGKAQAYQLVADHNRRLGRTHDCTFWRGLMRRAAQDALTEAKYNLGLIKYTYTGGAR